MFDGWEAQAPVVGRIAFAMLLGVVTLLGSYFVLHHIFRAAGLVTVIIEFIGGIVFVVVGAMLPKKDPAERPQKQVKAPDAKSASPQVKGSQRPQVQGGQPAAAARPAPKQAQKGLDPEDAEIEELLRKRGIM